MPEPTLVPPTPTINQPNGPVDNSPGLEQVQRAFDNVYPDTSKPRQPSTDTPPAPDDTPKPATPQPPESPPPTVPPEERKIPSFLEDALKPTTPESQPPPDPEADFPDDLPQDQKTSRIKGLRDAYKKLKEEVTTLRSTPNRDPQEQARLQWLEQNNRQMAEMLSRVGVEHSAEFQQNIMRPLTGAWNEAARIVRDAGADPQELAKVMSLQGRAQFEGLDNLFSDMPESARAEAHDALRAYRRFEAARQHAVANAPKTLEAIQQRETERQYQELSKQRSEMQNMFERAIARLRDEAKVELFQKTTDPEGEWWNKQGEDLVQQGRSLFLENTDMEKVALACAMAPTADAYRKLFLTSQKKVTELQQFIKERIGNEPNLSESGGNAGGGPSGSMQEDLKKPFADVFLREFHRAQGRNR